MTYSFKLNFLQRFSNPGGVWISWVVLLIGSASIIFHMLYGYDSLWAGCVFLFVGGLFYYLAIHSNPPVGTEISVEFSDEAISYIVGGDNTDILGKHVVNGAGKGCFGCGWITLTSGHSLLIPKDAVDAVKDFLH